MSEAVSDTAPAATETLGRRIRLWAEMLALFVGTPILMTVYFGHYPLLPTVAALAALSLLLLALTPGFRMAELLRGPVLGEWRIILGYVAIVSGVCIATVLALVPERLFELPLHRPELWLLIMFAYPIFSVLPQELIYRPLFFRRYGALFPNVGVAVAVNAILFGVGHLLFMQWVTIALTALGSTVIAWAYMRHRSFLLAVVLHALAGQIVFTVGLGIFFYHGAIGR